MRRSFYVTLLLSVSLTAPAQSSQKPDAATQAWWDQTIALSNDKMEGRDTGTEAYQRAAKYVAGQFQSAGLKPAGDNGTFFQRVPMHQIDLVPDKSSVEVLDPQGKVTTTLHFTTEVTTVPREAPISVEAPLIFLGYGMPPADFDLKGKIAVFFGNTPAAITRTDYNTFGARRLRALTQAGVAAILSIDNPSGTEPFHWPAAYARSVSIAGTTAPTGLSTTPAGASTPTLAASSAALNTQALLISGKSWSSVASQNTGTAGVPCALNTCEGALQHRAVCESLKRIVLDEEYGCLFCPIRSGQR